MASVNLEDVWVHDGEDFSDYQQFQIINPAAEDYETSGNVRVYAGGRKRYVGRVGFETTLTINLQWATRDELEWLRQHAGTMVMVRDTKGRLIFGVYDKVAVNDRKLFSEAVITLRLNEITHSLEV